VSETALTGGEIQTATVVPAAALRHVSKRFGATQALSDVSLELLPGSVHALVGENGAGKSTLVKILAGVHQPDTGDVAVEDRSVLIRDPSAARSLGIAVVHQEPSLFPDLSVAENVYLAAPPRGSLGRIDWAGARRRTSELFAQLDVRLDPAAPVRGLSMADQQLIEIAKALSFDAHVLVLDEPTASLSAHEVERLFAIVRRLRDRGVAVLFVGHRLHEIYEICDSATVLRDGRHVITAPLAELSTADLIRHMVGRAVSLFPKGEATIGATLLEARQLARAGEFEDISFAVRAGEIVGFAGLVGAGRTEIARALFGITRPTSGEIVLSGESVAFGSPSEAMNAGIAYVPEDRHQNGLVLDFSIAENVSLPILPRLFPRLFLSTRRERGMADEYITSLRIRTRGARQLVAALSGGNQQKVVIAKWLASNPRVLILDEPTRGIDIGAKVEVHRIISDLASSGIGIILISSELPEVIAMSDRILVLHEGRLTAEIARADATEEGIMFAATGQAATVPSTVASAGLPA
jgi:rhamnose transport system ATP-binding protein